MKYAYEQVIGHREIMNTNHPVKLVVYRGRTNRREWIVTRLCNGVASHTETFRTRWEAIQAAEAAH
jgi:hypothetical protein